jgi:hypothetical protein
VPLQQRLEPDLKDVRLSGVQCLDAIDVNIDPDHLMTEFGHSGGMGSTHVVRADDAYPQCHPQIFP